jgi:cyclic pyranopterin phosphate synthase
MVSNVGDMIDISGKKPVERIAVAEGRIRLRPETIKRIREGSVEKGDVLATMKIAAILAVKNTPTIIPHAHPIPIEWVGVDHEFIGDDTISVKVSVKTTWKTGVEMDALTGVAAALLTIWDMVKKYEKDEKGQYPYTVITGIQVIEKHKGR